jgi:hypothetical protein
LVLVLASTAGVSGPGAAATAVARARKRRLSFILRNGGCFGCWSVWIRFGVCDSGGKSRLKVLEVADGLEDEDTEGEAPFILLLAAFLC